MKKTKKIIVLSITVVIIILIAIIIYNVVFIPTSTKKTEPKEMNVSIDIKNLKMCQEGVECGIADIEYRKIELSNAPKKLQKIIDQINNEINESYEKSAQSTVTGAECQSVASLYQHSILSQSVVTTYEGKEVISIAVMNTEGNLCTNVSTEKELEVYYYDVQKDKLLSEEELKEKYSITDADIKTAIQESITTLNGLEGTNYSTDNIEEYKIYIQNDGEIFIYYKQPEIGIHYTASLNKNAS